MLVASCQPRFGDPACLAVWRAAGARPWDNEDRLLLSAAANLIRFVLEHEAIQREMARQARTDPLTGLLNRRAFLEEIARCAERLDREELPGTLMFVDIDNFKVVNDALGHEMGDQVLVHTADHAAQRGAPDRPCGAARRRRVRGLDERRRPHDRRRTRGAIAHAGAARDERAIGRQYAAPGRVDRHRHPRRHGSAEPIDSVLRRADMAMYAVKHHGRGHWLVAPEEPA